LFQLKQDFTLSSGFSAIVYQVVDSFLVCTDTFQLGWGSIYSGGSCGLHFGPSFDLNGDSITDFSFSHEIGGPGVNGHLKIWLGKSRTQIVLWDTINSVGRVNIVGVGTIFSDSVFTDTIQGIYRCDTVFNKVVNIFTELRGSLSYPSTPIVPLAGATLSLKDNGQIIKSANCDGSGNFDFGMVKRGHYDLEVGNLSSWRGVNATDALVVVRQVM
jgi:hypothetical protein